MAGSLDRMMQNMLKHSDAERAFMPWTQDVEDKLLYSLMILGKSCVFHYIELLFAKHNWNVVVHNNMVVFFTIHSSTVVCCVEQNSNFKSKSIVN